MKRLLTVLLGAFFCLLLSAQTAADEIRRNILCIASNYMAYPGPMQQVLSPYPEGMKPFYISHYGRHGSRYHTRPSLYDQPYEILLKADSLGKLTPLGHDVVLRLEHIRRDAQNRWGELTELGARQHQEIAHRMVERFPEVFVGTTDVDARSTTSGRCILSMEYALEELLTQNPELNVHHLATHRDMDFLNHQDKELWKMRFNEAAKKWYDAYRKDKGGFDHLMNKLFSDTAYVRQHIDMDDFATQLCIVAAIVQNTDLSNEVTLFDLFTFDEAYRIWQVGNAWWYIGWGAADVNDAVQPYSQRNLLLRLIDDADRVLRQPYNKVQLRFGHETVLIPLVCLLDIDGLGLTTHDLDELEQHRWINYHIAPMAGNLQFVFFRRDGQDRGDDVLFKVLLNENEATLPLPGDHAPYYRWSDFRSYYLKKLEAFDQKNGKKPVK